MQCFSILMVQRCCSLVYLLASNDFTDSDYTCLYILAFPTLCLSSVNGIDYFDNICFSKKFCKNLRFLLGFLKQIYSMSDD